MKELWKVFPALLLVAGLVFFGCGGGDDNGGDGTDGNKDGGEDGGKDGGEQTGWVADASVKIGDIIKIAGVDSFEAEDDSGELGKYNDKAALKLEVVTIQEDGSAKKVNKVTITFDPPVDLTDYEGITYDFGVAEIAPANLNGLSFSTEFINSTDDSTRKLGYWAGTVPKTYSFAIEAVSDDKDFDGFTFDTLIIQADAWQEKPQKAVESGIYLYSVVLKEKYVSENELVVFDGTALATGITQSGGTIGANGIAITPDVSGAKPSVKITFTFSPELDLSLYTRFVVEWEGIHSSFKQANFNLTFLSDNTEGGDTGQRKAQVGFQSHTIQYTLGTDLKDWSGDPTTWNDFGPECTSLEFFSDFMQANNWADITISDSDLEDFVITSFKFE